MDSYSVNDYLKVSLLIKNSLFLALPAISLFGGVVIVITSSSWVTAWIGLELNLLSFIPLISTWSKTINRALKYILTQAFASLILLLIILNIKILFWALPLALLLKLGAAPLHFWLPTVVQGLSWELNLVLLTIQKIAPLYLLSLTRTSAQVLLTLACLGGAVGALGGINEFSLRKILAFSSISHIGWILATISLSILLWLFYLIAYFLLTSLVIISVIKGLNKTSLKENFQPSQASRELSLNILSLRGFPPLLGFFPKWVSVFYLVQSSPLTTWILLLSSSVTLYFYLKVVLSGVVTGSSLPSFSTKLYPSSSIIKHSLSLTSLSTLVSGPLIWIFWLRLSL